MRVLRNMELREKGTMESLRGKRGRGGHTGPKEKVAYGKHQAAHQDTRGIGEEQ